MVVEWWCDGLGSWDVVVRLLFKSWSYREVEELVGSCWSCLGVAGCVEILKWSYSKGSKKCRRERWDFLVNEDSNRVNGKEYDGKGGKCIE